MSVHSEIKKITTETLRKMKFDKEKITMLTAYDYTTAKMVDAGGVDSILIGDSAANVMAGFETTLPITLDVGTNNQQLRNDPLYLGWNHPRISGDEYNQFIDDVIRAIQRRWPKALIQFEDFAQQNAMPLLTTYREQICCFNDDIQGTAAVALASLIAASHVVKKQVKDQTIVILGAGSAGCGIAEQIIAQMKIEGLSDLDARSRLYLVDRFGLMTEQQPNLLDFQSKLAQPLRAIETWANVAPEISLLEVIQHAKPTVLIGVSGQTCLFS